MSTVQPYSQGLVPAINQMQMAAPMQTGVTSMPNAGQNAYLASLQNQIKQSQQAEAQGMQGYENTMGQVAAANKKAAASSSGGGLGSLLGSAFKIATALL